MMISAAGNDSLPLTLRRTLLIAAAYLGVLAAAAILTLASFYWTRALHPSTRQHSLVIRVSSLMAFLVVLLGLGSTWIVHLTRRSFPGAAWPTVLAALGWRRPERNTIQLALCAGLMLALCEAWVAIFTMVPFGPRMALHSGVPLLARLPTVVMALLFAPPIEEFLFRGVFLAGLANAIGGWAAMIGLTILFALGHGAVAHDWRMIAPILITGALLMAIRMRTSSLWPGIAFHAAYNAVFSAIYLVT